MFGKKEKEVKEEVKNDIGSMLDALDPDVETGDLELEPKVEPDPEPEPDPVPDPKNEPDPEPEPKKDNEPEPDPEPAPKDPDPEPAPELDSKPKLDPEPDPEPEDKDKIIENLRLRLEESGKKSDPEPEPKPDKKKEEELTLETQDFLADFDLENLARDPEAVNKLMNSVYSKAVTDTRKILGEGVLRTIPDIVKNNIIMIGNLQKTTEKFYKDNEDLKPFGKVVGTVFEELASENPDKKYDELLVDLEKEVRNRLELHKKVNKETKETKDNPPKLPRKKGETKHKEGKPDTGGLQSQIDQMNETLN